MKQCLSVLLFLVLSEVPELYNDKAFNDSFNMIVVVIIVAVAAAVVVAVVVVVVAAVPPAGWL